MTPRDPLSSARAVSLFSPFSLLDIFTLMPLYSGIITRARRFRELHGRRSANDFTSENKWRRRNVKKLIVAREKRTLAPSAAIVKRMI